MTAIISGNGLGLFNSSLNQLGGALGGHPGLGQGQTSQYVNIVTGNLIMHGEDERLLARGLLVEIERTYNSRGVLTSTGASGVDLWTFSFETKVQLISGTVNTAGSVVQRTVGDGTTVTFAYDAQAGVYRSTAGDGAHDAISYDTASATWTWTEGGSQRQEVYDATKQGLLIKVRDTRSGTENLFERNPSGRLERILTQNGDAVVFGYDGSTGKLLSVGTVESGVAKSQVRYTYDGFGRLARIEVDLTPDNGWTDNGVGSTYSFFTEYEYADDTPRIKRASRGMSQSDGVEVYYEYYTDGPNRDKLKSLTVGSVADGSAQTQTFSYDSVNRTTDVTDGAGRTWTYRYDAAGQLIEVLSPAENGLRQRTWIEYNGAGDVTRVVDAEQRETVYEYDAQGNVVLQREHAGNTIRRTFDARNQLLTQSVYAVADPDGAGAGQPSDAMVTRYIYDERGRVAFQIAPEGEVTEYAYDAVTGLVSSVIRYTQDRYPIAGLGEQQSPSQQSLRDWANVVLVSASSAGGAAPLSRTDFTYDARGLLSRTMAYGKVDSNGIGILDAEAELTEHVYDAHGLLADQITYRGSGRTIADRVSRTYDGLGRILSTRDAAGNVSTWVYDDAGQRLIVTQANGLVRTETLDKAGRTILVTESATSTSTVRTERRYYDVAGRLRASEDSNGARTYFFYDAAGQLTGEVDVTGAVVEYRRDQTGLILETFRYANRADTGAWLVNGRVQPESLASILPAADATQDRATLNHYDAAGRLASQTDAEGTVTTYEFDGASRLLKTTATRPTEPGVEPRVTRYFYDDSGRQVAVLDAEGHLTEWRFDAAGRQVALVRYATTAPESMRAAGTLDELRPAPASDDQVTRAFYNARNLQVGELNAEGYLTEFVYDEANRQRATRVYNQRLAGLSGTEGFLTLRAQVQAEGARETRRVFDERGLLAVEVNAEGTTTRYAYDAMGQLVHTETGDGATDIREGGLRYDVFGNLIGELGGEGQARITAGMTEAQKDAIYAQYGIRHSHDVLGRRTESIDAEGNKTWYFYDSAGRLTHTVRGVADVNGVRNAEGEVVETRYDTFGQVIETTAYSGRITIGSPFGREQVAQAVSVLRYVAAQDSRQSFAYDRRGAITARTDANGFRTWLNYNAFGDLVRETREIAADHTIITEHDYDRLGWLQTTVEDAAGARRTLSQTWDAFGRVTSTTDGRDLTAYRVYDRLGRQVVQYQTVGGRLEQWSTAYDAHGRVTTQTDALGRDTKYFHDDATRSIAVVTPEGVSLRTERNRFGETARVVDAFGNETIYRYDLDGHLVETEDATGARTGQAFDNRGLLTRTTDATARAVGYRYDAAGRVLERIEDPDGLHLTTRYAYDAQGRQVAVTDPAGVVTRMRYDGNGQLLETVQDANGLALRTTYTWDGVGHQLSVTEAAGTATERITEYQYDNLGRRIRETRDVGTLNQTTLYTYDSSDNLVRRVDAEGRVSRFGYDEANRLIVQVDGEGGVSRSWYDTAGRAVASRQYANAIDLAGLSDTATASELLARVTSDNSRDVQSFRVLDRDGRVHASIDGTGGVTTTAYDAAGRLVSTYQYANRLVLDDGLRAQLQAGGMGLAEFANPVTSVQDRVTYQVYDDAGRVRYTVDGLGNLQQFDYDAAGRNVGSRRFVTPVALDAALRESLAEGTATVAQIDVHRVAAPTGDLRSYQVLDTAGRLRFTVDAAGNVVQYYVDELGRTVGSRQYARPVGLDAALEQQLAAGTATIDQITGSLQSDEAHDLRSYQVLDALGRVRFSIDATGAVQEFQLDAAGNVTGSRRYAQAIAIDSALLASLRDGAATPTTIANRLTADGARDVRMFQLLDDAGRVRFVVDSEGAVQETRYDATGLAIQQLAYTAMLSDTELAAIETGTWGRADLEAWGALHSAGARQATFVHDEAGRLRYVLTRENAALASVQERRYDGAGQLVAEVAYGSLIPLATTASASAVAAAVTAAGGDAPDAHRATRHVFDTAGRQRFSIDASGVVTEQRLDGAGRVVQTRSYDQRVTTSATTEAAVIDALAGSQVRVTTTKFDAAGRVWTVTDALGQAETFEYDGAGQKTAYINRDQHRWTYAYDTAGRLIREASPQVRVAEVGSNGQVVTTSRSVVTRIEYDALGNVVARIEDAETASARRTEYAYDNRGRQIRTTFPDAGIWNAATGQFDAAGRPTTEVVYDSLDRAVVHKDVRGNYSYRVYDATGQLRFEVDQEGYVTGYEYNAYGEQVSLTRYAQPVTVAAGQPITLAQMEALRQVSPGADRTLITRYSATGQKLEVHQDLTTWYDESGASHAGRPTTRFEYDAYGQLVREAVLLDGEPDVAGARWAETFRYYDAVGRITHVVDAEGYLTESSYSAQGEVLSQTEYARALTGPFLSSLRPAAPQAGDAVSGYDRKVTYKYDALGRKVSETSLRHAQGAGGADATREVLTTIDYDNEGHALTTTVDGVATATAYDALGRAVAVNESERDVLVADAEARLAGLGVRLDSLDERVSPYTDMLYDAFGNVVQVHRYANGLKAGQTAAVASNADQIHVTRYDRQGRSIWERDPMGTVYTRRYDAADNLIETRSRLDGNEGRWSEVVTTAQYDRVGRQTTSSVVRELYIGQTRLHIDGQPAFGVDAQSTVRYNAFGEIVAKDDTVDGAFAVGRTFAQYAYDAAGRLVSSNAEGGVWRQYGYNLAGHQVRESHAARTVSSTGAVEMTDAVTTSQTDRLGRTTKQVLPAYSDELDKRPAVLRHYDRWGNVTEVVDPRGANTQYRYNELNQIVLEIRPEVRVLHENGTETRERPTIAWFYDALGRQVGTRDANGNISSVGYDAAGRVTSTTDAVNNTTRLAYDALGQQRLSEDPLGYVTFREFDLGGRIKAQGDFLTKSDYSGRTRELRESYLLNQNGDRLAVTDALGNTARYDYDSRGLLLRSRTAAGVVMSYAYDSQGRKIRETNALSDPSLIDGSQPVYNGNIIVNQVVVAGQPYRYVIPADAFTIPSGETPVPGVVVEILNPATGTYSRTNALTYNAQTRALEGTPPAGFHAVRLSVTSGTGQSVNLTIGVNVVSQATFDAEYAGKPVIQQPLKDITVTAGVPFSYQIPGNAFVDPQGQPLTHKVEVLKWQTYTDPEPQHDGTRLTYTRLEWVELPTSTSPDDLLAFDPNTRTLLGKIGGVVTELRIIVTDPDGNSVSQRVDLSPLTVTNSRHTVVDDEGETLFRDEQTWDYNYFGQLVDHNDLSGADYDYLYDAASGQQIEQRSDWSDAARQYSNPFLDYLQSGAYLEDTVHDLFRNGLADLQLPEPELTNDPKRSLSYYANGQLKEIREGNHWTRYQYDAAGNRTAEDTVTTDANGQVLRLCTLVSYDAHNRIVKVTQDEMGANGEPTRRLLELRYDYDAGGNRRRVMARNAYDPSAPVIGFVNQPPTVLNVVAPQHIILGETWSFKVPNGTFFDPEGGMLQVTATLADGSPLPSWLVYDEAARTFRGTPTETSSLSVRLTATDVEGLSITTDFALTASPNQPPVVVGSIEPQTAYLGLNWTLQTASAFADPEGRPLTYSATLADGSPLPDWLHIDPSTGQISGTAREAASLSIRVIATDSAGASVEVTFDLTAQLYLSPFNPDFELGDVGWTYDAGFRIEGGGGAYSGSWKAVDLGLGVYRRIINNNRVPVTAGQALQASCYYHQGSADAGDNKGAVLLVWYDEFGNEVGITQGSWVNSSDGGFQVSGVVGYAPANARYAAIGAQSYKTDSDAVRFDNFQWSYDDTGLPPENTTDNLGFEAGDAGWNKGAGWSIVESGGLSSGWSARYDGGDTPSSISNQMRVPVQPGETYTASCWVQQGASDAGDAGGAVVIEWYDANGNVLSWNTGNVVSSGSGGAWHQSTATGTAPAGAVSMSVAGSARKSTGHSLWLDNFAWSRVSSTGGGSGGGGGGGGEGGPIQQQSVMVEPLRAPDDSAYWDEQHGGWRDPDLDDAYNSAEPYKSYWYTYDTSNRVAVANGQLRDGTIVLGSADISYALDYDEAGHAVRRRFLQGSAQMAETTAYDERGQRTSVSQALEIGSSDWAGPLESFRWDAAGHLLERREYFANGTRHSNGVDIGGWLKHAEIFSYDADGRVLRQDVKGRALGWVAYAPPPPPTPPSGGPGSPEVRIMPDGEVAYFQRGVYGEFTLPAGTFVDPEGGPVSYAKTGGPTWLQYETLADGTHRFYGAPNTTSTSEATRQISLSATDNEGKTTTLTFTIYIEGTEGDGGGGGGEVPVQPLMVTTASTSDSPEFSNLGVLTDLSAVQYGTEGYDTAGRLRAYQYQYYRHEYGSDAESTDPTNYRHTYFFQYEGRDGYLESKVYGYSTNANFRASNTRSECDAWGRRIAVREQTPLPSELGTLDDRIRYFSYDAEGNILRRREGTLENGAFTQTAAQLQQDQLYAYVGGQQVATGKRNGEVDIVGRLTAYDSSEVGSISITVQAGDTLRGIAQRVYGNGNLWYVVAEANAITDAQLTAGTQLRVPEVKVTANDATTFKPFNPGEAIGNTAPSLPYITPPKQQQCSFVAVVLMMVVAVVVTAFTYGQAAPYFQGLLASQVGGAMAAGFVAGAAGSVASQGVGSAMGATSFSWRQVAVDGITTAVTMGAGQAMSGVGAFTKGAKIAGELNTLGRVTQGLISYGGTVVANAVVGRDTNFSWNAVAASALGAYVSAKAGGRVPITKGGTIGGNFLNNFAGLLVDGAANTSARRLMGFGKQDWGRIAADAFGNALGNVVVGGIQTAQANRAAKRAAVQSGMPSLFDPDYKPEWLYSEDFEASSIEQDAAAERLFGQSSASLGSVSSADPLDLLRKRSSFLAGTNKLLAGKDATILYGSRLARLMAGERDYAVSAQSGWFSGGTATTVVLGSDELADVQSALHFADPSLDSTTKDGIVLVVGAGASQDSVNALISSALGGTITETDLRSIGKKLGIENGTVPSTTYLDIAGLRDAAAGRFVDMIYNDPRVAGAYASEQAARAAIAQLPRDASGWGAAQAAGNNILAAEQRTQDVITQVRSELQFKGYQPRREFVAEKLTDLYKGIAVQLATIPVGALWKSVAGRIQSQEVQSFLQVGESPFKGQRLTNAGRATTKHPEYFGFNSTEELRAVYRTDAQLNELGRSNLQMILANGTRTAGAGGRYPNGWVTYTLPDGRAASWHSAGEFIGFRGKSK